MYCYPILSLLCGRVKIILNVCITILKRIFFLQSKKKNTIQDMELKLIILLLKITQNYHK